MSGPWGSLKSDPWGLDRGLTLDGTRTLLPWLTPLDVLRSIGAPEITTPGDTVDLRWSGRLALGGLPLSFVTTHMGRGDGESGLCPWLYADRLLHLDLTRAFEHGRPSVREEYASTKAHLLAGLEGIPERTDDRGLPYVLWRNPGYSLSFHVCERMGGEYCNLRITHASARHL